jgi:hypothetical protein
LGRSLRDFRAEISGFRRWSGSGDGCIELFYVKYSAFYLARNAV